MRITAIGCGLKQLFAKWPKLAKTYIVAIGHKQFEHDRTTTQIAMFMGPTCGPPGSCRPQMGPMWAPRTLLSGQACRAVPLMVHGCGQTSHATGLVTGWATIGRVIRGSFLQLIIRFITTSNVWLHDRKAGHATSSHLLLFYITGTWIWAHFIVHRILLWSK